MLASRENLDWMNEAPKMSYNATIGRPVFMNKEAFYLCLSGTADKTILEGIEWEVDESFKKFYKEQTGQPPNPELISQFIGNMVAGANENYKSQELNEGMDIFRVPEDDPNTENQKEIEWYNTENLDKANQKFNQKIYDRIGQEELDPSKAVELLGKELAGEAKNLTEYDFETKMAEDSAVKFAEWYEKTVSGQKNPE